MFLVFNLVPGALIDGVVDRDDGAHIGGVEGIVFTFHSGEKHCFGGVDPVYGGGGGEVGEGGAGDRTYDAVVIKGLRVL